MNNEEKKINPSAMEDKRLILDFLGNDAKAFDRLVLKYKNDVFNLCCKFLNDYDEADDTAQDTFVKVYHGLKKFKFESSFSTWLYRIAVNTCKNKAASAPFRARRSMIPLDRPKESNNGKYAMEIKDDKNSPDKLFERKEKQNAIREAIDSLDGKQKSMVILRDIEGLSYEEIAVITKCKLGTIKSKLARARERLREKLQDVI